MHSTKFLYPSFSSRRRRSHCRLRIPLAIISAAAAAVCLLLQMVTNSVPLPHLLRRLLLIRRHRHQHPSQQETRQFLFVRALSPPIPTRIGDSFLPGNSPPLYCYRYDGTGSPPPWHSAARLVRHSWSTRQERDFSAGSLASTSEDNRALDDSFDIIDTTSSSGDRRTLNVRGKQQQQQLLETIPSNSSSNNSIEHEEDRVYRELQLVATQLWNLDALYYNHAPLPDEEVEDDSSGIDDSNVSAATATAASSFLRTVSDDEYDALAHHEADLCRRYPALLQKWRNESGWGIRATRYDGRVGSATTIASAVETRNGDNVGDSSVIGIDEAVTDIPHEPRRKAVSTPALQRLKRTHAKPMLSLDNAHSIQEVLTWLERIRKKVVSSASSIDSAISTVDATVEIVTEPKLDGVSLSLRYARHTVAPEANSSNQQQYILQWASTRGDGRIGTDVSQAVLDMGTIPLKVLMKKKDPKNNNSAFQDFPDGLEIRGEVIVPLTVFEQWQRDYRVSQTVTEPDSGMPRPADSAPLFSNARNAASGILLRKDTIPTQSAINATIDSDTFNIQNDSQKLRATLQFYAYEIIPLENVLTNATFIEAKESMEQIGSATNMRDSLKLLGFSVPMPSISTILRLPANESATDSDSSQSLAMWSEADISNMVQYHDALAFHRDARNKEQSRTDRKTTSTTATGDFEWGDFDMDGCVHKVANDDLRTLLGNSNRAPRWAVAHKFAPTTAVTELTDIEIQVGRTGALTPVAILKPVDLCGVTIKRATMHNFAHMQQLLGGVNRIRRNSTVIVRRAGDVIPQVVSRVTNPLPEEYVNEINSSFLSLTIPTHCPSCGSDAFVDELKAAKSSSVGQVVRCGGPALLCSPRAVAALRHAYARDAFDVTGLSEARIQQLMDAGFLRIPSDIFVLAQNTSTLEEIAKLDGWGAKSVDNLAAVAQRVANDGVSLARFIFSLGIRTSGARSSAQIAALYGSVESFLLDLDQSAELNSEDVEALSGTFPRLIEDTDATKGIGPTILAALREFSSKETLVDAAHQLAANIKVIDDTTLDVGLPSQLPTPGSVTNRPLHGQSVVFTGSILKLSRPAAQALALEMGAKSTPSTVSKTTGMVVTGDKQGKKLQQAEKLGVRIVYADEFLQMVEKFRSQ